MVIVNTVASITIGSVFGVVRDVTDMKTTNKNDNRKGFDRCLILRKTSGMSSVILCESKLDTFNENVDKDNGGKIQRRQIFVGFQLVSLDRVYCVHDTVTSGWLHNFLHYQTSDCH